MAQIKLGWLREVLRVATSIFAGGVVVALALAISAGGFILINS